MARRQQGTPESNAVEVILRTLWELFTLPFKNRTKGMNPSTAAVLAQHWGGVTDLLSSQSTEAMAVSEADKLLDAAMQALNLPGDRMADRLKAAEGRLGRDLANQVWRAHKLRNQLAHEVGARLAPGQARVAISAFQKALRVLGVPI